MISRYLAGHLPVTESEAFERALSEQPELRDQVDQHLRFKEGLARLHERGELDTLIRETAPRRWLPYAAAAALTIVTFGGLIWFQVSSRAPALLALSPTEFATPGHESPSIVGTYTLARMRGESPDIKVTAPRSPGAIEFRVLPSTLSTDVRYNVRINRLGESKGGASIGRIDAGAAGPDGYVTVYLNSQKLTPGDYEVSLSPSAMAEPATEIDRFTIRVR